MEEDEGVGGELGQPGVEVVGDGVVGVEAVDVEEIDGGVGEAADGLVEGAAVQRGKLTEAGVVMGFELVIDGGGEGAGVFIAGPGVDGVAGGREVEDGGGLAEGAVGGAAPGAQLDEVAGSEGFHEEHGEGDVLDPGGGLEPVRHGEHD